MSRKSRSKPDQSSPLAYSISKTVSPYFSAENGSVAVTKRRSRRRGIKSDGFDTPFGNILSSKTHEPHRNRQGRVMNERSNKRRGKKSWSTCTKPGRGRSIKKITVIASGGTKVDISKPSDEIEIQTLDLNSSISENVEDSENEWKPQSDTDETNSSDEFESVSSKSPASIDNNDIPHCSSHRESKCKRRRTQDYKRRPPKHTSKKESYLHSADEDNDNNWEEVVDRPVDEVDMVVALLHARRNLERSVGDKVDGSEASVSVTVPLGHAKKKSNTKDPSVLAKQAHVRQMKELRKFMHCVHVSCFLAHARSLNLRCDSSLYRALGLSLLSGITTIRDRAGNFLSQHAWTVNHLKQCLNPLLSRADASVRGSRDRFFISRLAADKPSLLDCIMLFVAALRFLNFDVRLVVGLRNPVGLKTDETPQTANRISSIKTKRTVTKRRATSKSKSKKENRKIISSSSSDGSLDHDIFPQQPQKGLILSRSVLVYAEVFLPSLGSWVCVDVFTPGGIINVIPENAELLYVVGLSTCLGHSVNCNPYLGRTPIDLSARYDPNWLSSSRKLRLPEEHWMRLINLQKSICNRDAMISMAIKHSNNDEISEVMARDHLDEHRIRLALLKQPLPNKMSDFKNHPLYVLRRYLLNYQVLYPPDATPVDYINKEPIYSRECLYLCHTRETWLRQAKVVRINEKPAKTVKARMSMKRKLLQGSDPNPQLVELFGPWQVEDYQPPVAQNNVVPRNEHGTVDLFKPSMLPIGCVQINLTGINLIAKKLQIDHAPAITGWKFTGRGFAIPIFHGYVVCKEHALPLVKAWHANQMNAAKAAATDRTERAVGNWRRLVRGLSLWNRVRAQYALAALHSIPKGEQTKARRPMSSSSHVYQGAVPVLNSTNGYKAEAEQNTDIKLVPAPEAVVFGSVTSEILKSNDCSWKRLASLDHTDTPILTLRGLNKCTPMSAKNTLVKKRSSRVKARQTPVAKKGRLSKRVRRKRKDSSSDEENSLSLDEFESEPSVSTPTSSDSD